MSVVACLLLCARSRPLVQDRDRPSPYFAAIELVCLTSGLAVNALSLTCSFALHTHIHTYTYVYTDTKWQWEHFGKAAAAAAAVNWLSSSITRHHHLASKQAESPVLICEANACLRVFVFFFCFCCSGSDSLSLSLSFSFDAKCRTVVVVY